VHSHTCEVTECSRAVVGRALRHASAWAVAADNLRLLKACCCVRQLRGVTWILCALRVIWLGCHKLCWHVACLSVTVKQPEVLHKLASMPASGLTYRLRA
jgi:hypothetical protein